MSRHIFSGKLHGVFSAADQLDNGERKVGEMIGIRVTLRLEKCLQTLCIRIAG